MPGFDLHTGLEAHLVHVVLGVLGLIPLDAKVRVCSVRVVGSGGGDDVLRDRGLKLRLESQEASGRG